MSETWAPVPGHSRERSAIELTRFALQKHYWESNVAADETIFDEPFFWFGAAEPEFSVDREAVLSLFRQFPGKVPRCSLTDEDFHAAMIGPDVCMVAGRFWVATDPSTGVFIRFHQRISTCVRWREGKARICMLHLSNPYVEMTEGDVGFPTQMAQQSRDYMRRQLEEQKRKIAQQAEELSDIYNTVSCGILRLLRTEDGYRLLTSNRAAADLIGVAEEEVQGLDWSRGFAEDVFAEDIPLVQGALEQLREPGDRTSIDYRLRSKSGRAVYLHASNKLISRDEEGEIIQRLTYDVTERIELERALKRMSFEDALTGLFNRNRFNQTVAAFQRQRPGQLGVACFDLNGLKRWNDQYGHSAGDDLIRRTAAHIGAAFPGRAYRIGGDEFVVLDAERGERAFRASVEAALEELRREDISVSAGASWRGGDCDVTRQVDEADRLMYEEKGRFYGSKEHDRRRR